MNLGSKGMSGRLLQYFTRHTTPDLGGQRGQTPPSCGRGRGTGGAGGLTSPAGCGGSWACGETRGVRDGETEARDPPPVGEGRGGGHKGTPRRDVIGTGGTGLPVPGLLPLRLGLDGGRHGGAGPRGPLLHRRAGWGGRSGLPAARRAGSRKPPFGGGGAVRQRGGHLGGGLPGAARAPGGPLTGPARPRGTAGDGVREGKGESAHAP